MFSKEEAKKIDLYLHKNFDIIFDFEFNGLMLLVGGAVKNLIMGEPIKDLDFVLLTQGESNIKQFFDKNNINYRKKRQIGYDFIYNGIRVDIVLVNDLYYAGNLNTDLLFYDIGKKQFIPIGVEHAIKNNKIVVYYYSGYFSTRRRIRKAKKFIHFMNQNNKKIKVKHAYNIYYRIFVATLKKPRKLLRFFKNYKFKSR